MTPEERAIWAAAYGAAFAAEVREHEQASDETTAGGTRLTGACRRVDIDRCAQIADSALYRLLKERPLHEAALASRDEPAQHVPPPMRGRCGCGYEGPRDCHREPSTGLCCERGAASWSST